MKKDKKWLKEELMGLKFKISEIGKVRLGEVFELVDQLDEPEQTDTNVGLSKVVIPQFVAEHITKWSKSNVSLSYALSTLRDELTLFKGSDEKVKFWLYDPVDGFDNQELYARAWLDGYEVEKEKKYQVIIKDGEYIRLFLCKHGDNVMIGTNENYIEKCPEVTYLTEKEIKDYDERFWVFAEEVTE